jgi:hypothetical protein
MRGSAQPRGKLRAISHRPASIRQQPAEIQWLKLPVDIDVAKFKYAIEMGI